MTEFKKIGDLHAKIAKILRDELSEKERKLLYIAELRPGFLCSAALSDEGDHIENHCIQNELSTPTREAWKAEPPNKRWTVMEMVIQNGRFEVDFTFPGELPAEEDTYDRQERIIKQHFGDKPVTYVGWSDF